MSYLFLLYQSPSSSLCTVFDCISSNIDEFLSINPSAVFVFGNLNAHHQNFSIPNDFTQVVNFPTWIPDCNSQSPALLVLFLSSDASIYSTNGFPSTGKF